jgi:hypothetical protein
MGGGNIAFAFHERLPMIRKVPVVIAVAVCAALAVWAVLRHGSSSSEPAPQNNATTAPAGSPALTAILPPAGVAATSASAARGSYVGIDESLAQLPPTPVAGGATAPPLQSLVGQWSGTITGFELDDEASSTLVDPAGLAPFVFVIDKQGDDFVLKRAGDGAAVRHLKSTTTGFVAHSAEGRGDIQLTMDGQTLVGRMQLPALQRGRMEFHAMRKQ